MKSVGVKKTEAPPIVFVADVRKHFSNEKIIRVPGENVDVSALADFALQMSDLFGLQVDQEVRVEGRPDSESVQRTTGHGFSGRLS
jgi:hypothetical protein